MKKKVICEKCGEETFLRTEPIYEGFKKIGDAYFCMLCGFEYQEEALQDAKSDEKKNSFFTEDDLEKVPDLFAEEKDANSCWKCKNYIINAFQQKCGLTQRNVSAMDVCFSFEKEEKESAVDDKK
ncbi:MAG: hypothetical protein PF692_03485 [Kiritimatiellae bacterium]|jgi:hypothetical protein|nr:hypothetical protein [Kiritimatiellia bacterium]